MSTDDRDKDFDATSKRELFEEARDRLKMSIDSDQWNRERAKEDMRFREGEQWPPEPLSPSASMEKPQLTINLTDTICQRIENNIREQRPTPIAHPVGDGADTERADIINGILRHIDARSTASVAYDQAARDALTGGFGYFRLLSEYEHERSFKKELRIAPIRNVFTVYMDPSAMMPAGEDMGWCIISSLMRRTEYKRRYPKAKNVDFTYSTSNDYSNLDWESQEHVRLAEYFRIVHAPEKLHGLRDKVDGTEYTLFDSELPKDWQKRQPRLKLEGSRDSLRRRPEWFRLNGLEVIERETLPGSYIPVFRVEGNRTDIDGQTRTRGMVRFLKDPQRMINYGETATIMRLGLAPKAPWVMAEGQIDGHEDEWTSANQSSLSVLVYKPVTIATSQGEVPLPPPTRQPPAQVEAGFMQLTASMRTNLLAVAGVPNEPGADQQGQVVSGVALQRRAQLTDKSHAHYYEKLTLAVQQCAKVCLDWIPATYSEPGRIQRIIGADKQPQVVTLNAPAPPQQPPVAPPQGMAPGMQPAPPGGPPVQPQQPLPPAPKEDSAVEAVKNDMTVGRYDITMDTGPGYETRREEGAQALIDLLKSPPLAQLIASHGADLLFRSIDHPYMQELADRIVALTPQGLEKVMEQLPQRARSIVQALSQQLQQAQAALQQAALENKYRMGAETLRAQTKAHDIAVQAETKRADTQSRDDTAIKIEKLKVGGSLLNTHVEAVHNAVAANQALQSAEKVEASS